MDYVTVIVGCICVFAVHEIGHLIVARWHNMKVKRIGASWRGPYVAIERGTAIQNFHVAFGGIAVNLILAALLWAKLPLFARFNLELGLFCMLPIKGTDGMNAAIRYKVWKDERKAQCQEQQKYIRPKW